MENLSVKALRELARELGLTGYSKLRKDDLLKQIKKARAKKKAVQAAPKNSVNTAKTGKKTTKPQTGKTVARVTETTQAQLVPLTAGGETEEERIESAKYFFPQTHDQFPQDLGEDIDHLPFLAGPRLTLLAQKPGVLQAAWHLAPGTCARQPGLQLRLGLMANRRFQVVQDVDVKTDHGTYYFHVDPSWPQSAIYLQLGFVGAGGRFVIAIPRGIVRLPRLMALTSLGVNWALEEEEFEHVVAQSGALTRRSSNQAPGAPSSQEWITSGGPVHRD